MTASSFGEDGRRRMIQSRHVIQIVSIVLWLAMSVFLAARFADSPQWYWRWVWLLTFLMALVRAVHLIFSLRPLRRDRSGPREGER
jgi:MFS family permease